MSVEEKRKRIKELQKGRYLPLYGDIQFKYIFGSNDNINLTKKLFEWVFKLPKGSLDGSIIYNEIKLDRETVKSKSFELDVLLKTPKENMYSFEMQRELNRNAEIKNTLYISKLSNAVKKNESYVSARKVCQLELVKFNYQHKTNRIINYYHIANDEDITDKIIPDIFEIVIINIDNIEEKRYNEEVDEEIKTILRLINAETLKVALEVAGTNLQLLEVLESLVVFNNNEYVQDYSREKALIESNMESAVEEAKSEGRAEGINIGEKSKAIEIARELILDGMNDEKISRITKLSIDEVKRVRDEVNL